MRPPANASLPGGSRIMKRSRIGAIALASVAVSGLGVLLAVRPQPTLIMEPVPVTHRRGGFGEHICLYGLGASAEGGFPWQRLSLTNGKIEVRPKDRTRLKDVFELDDSEVVEWFESNQVRNGRAVATMQETTQHAEVELFHTFFYTTPSGEKRSTSVSISCPPAPLK